MSFLWNKGIFVSFLKCNYIQKTAYAPYNYICFVFPFNFWFLVSSLIYMSTHHVIYWHLSFDLLVWEFQPCWVLRKGRVLMPLHICTHVHTYAHINGIKVHNDFWWKVDGIWRLQITLLKTAWRGMYLKES